MEQGAAEIPGLQPLDGIQLRRDDRLLQRRVRHDGVDERRHVHRILVVEEHAGAVHCCRHRRRRVRDHRHLLVEGLDDRHAEAFVLAGTQKDVGDIVKRHQLLV